MRKTLSFLSGLAAGLLLLELVLRLLPVNSALRLQDTGPQQPFYRFVPDQPYTYSHGWAFTNARRGVINHDGFNNSGPLHDGQLALLIGDSYIESFMLTYGQTVQGRLDAALPGGVTAAAVSGNGLADSLEIIRRLGPQYHPRNVIMFVEATDIAGLLAPPVRGHSAFALRDGSVKVEHNPYHESGAKQALARSALVRYVYYNLKLPEWISGQLAALHGGAKAKDAAADAQQAQLAGQARRQLALDYYFAQLKQVQARTGSRFIFLVDADRQRIYAGSERSVGWGAGDREWFLGQVRAAGFAVADTEPAFAAHWQQYREHVDFLPADGHWNSVGHQLAAQQLIPLLQAPSR